VAEETEAAVASWFRTRQPFSDASLHSAGIIDCGNERSANSG
jgi:hypothetical protein